MDFILDTKLCNMKPLHSLLSFDAQKVYRFMSDADLLTILSMNDLPARHKIFIRSLIDERSKELTSDKESLPERILLSKDAQRCYFNFSLFDLETLLMNKTLPERHINFIKYLIKEKLAESSKTKLSQKKAIR